MQKFSPLQIASPFPSFLNYWSQCHPIRFWTLHTEYPVPHTYVHMFFYFSQPLTPTHVRPHPGSHWTSFHFTFTSSPSALPLLPCLGWAPPPAIWDLFLPAHQTPWLPDTPLNATYQLSSLDQFCCLPSLLLLTVTALWRLLSSQNLKFSLPCFFPTVFLQAYNCHLPLPFSTWWNHPPTSISFSEVRLTFSFFPKGQATLPQKSVCPLPLWGSVNVPSFWICSEPAFPALAHFCCLAQTRISADGWLRGKTKWGSGFLTPHWTILYLNKIVLLHSILLFCEKRGLHWNFPLLPLNSESYSSIQQSTFQCHRLNKVHSVKHSQGAWPLVNTLHTAAVIISH